MQVTSIKPTSGKSNWWNTEGINFQKYFSWNCLEWHFSLYQCQLILSSQAILWETFSKSYTMVISMAFQIWQILTYEFLIFIDFTFDTTGTHILPFCDYHPCGPNIPGNTIDYFNPIPHFISICIFSKAIVTAKQKYFDYGLHGFHLKSCWAVWNLVLVTIQAKHK